jgi:uncharacterized protein (DUF433 family)
MSATQTLAAHPRIERARGFGGEVAMVAGTRLPVFLLLHQMRSAGWDEAEVIQNYPQLSPEDLHAVLEYGRSCPREVAADDATYDASLLAYGG